MPYANNNILTGELFQDPVKERGKNYPPSANSKYLIPTMVNEEMNRNSKTVDRTFQCVQEPIVEGLPSFAILADRLFKDSQSAKTGRAGNPDERD